MFFRFCYDCCLHLYVCALLPFVFFRFAKYKGSLLKRLGRDFPTIQKKGKKLIWIHAVSLGETKAAASLIKKLKTLESAPLILLTSSTQTGHAEGQKTLADYCAYLPFDFSYVIRPIVARIAPDIALLTETDFWFHFQDAAKKAGASIFLINGKISKRSFIRFSRVAFLAKRLLGSIDHFYVQSEEYKSRFEQLGVPTKSLSVVGNLKLDCELDSIDVFALKRQLGLNDTQVLTLGSTHHPEEQIWLGALKEIWQKKPDLKVMIVPRHPERFDAVAQLLQSHKISFSRWSEQGVLNDVQVLLVDAMGVLKKCYQISDIAFVGGSFTSKVGGHNILEPSLYGKPVLFGPFMHSQPDFRELALLSGAGLQISQENVVSTVFSLLDDPSRCQRMGESGRRLFVTASGALDRIFSALRALQ